MPHQLIYRLDRAEPFDVTLPQGCRFVLCNGVRDGLQLAPLLVRRVGLTGLAKDILKLATPRRMYACLVGDDAIVSDCYVNVSRCKHYDVEDGAAVLGPVWTNPAARGKGLATRLLKLTLNGLLPRGHRIFYIDTSDANAAMQHVVTNCGFGEPVKSIPKDSPIR